MPEVPLLIRAADCYRRAGRPLDEARCYRAGGLYLRAAQTWAALEAFAEAARDYAAANAHDDAAWIFVHHLGDVATARTQLAAAEAAAAAQDAAGQPGQAGGLAVNSPVTRKAAEVRRGVIRARCDAAEGVRRAESAAALDAAMDHIEFDTQSLFPISTEQLAVATAEAMDRPDLVALLFAAAVRGGHHQAVERWNEWFLRKFRVPLILPEPDNSTAVPGGGATSGPRRPPDDAG